MRHSSMNNPVTILDECLDNAIEAWFPGEDNGTCSAREELMRRVEVEMWPQSHSNMGLGFPGIAGQAITRAMTVVVIYQEDAQVLNSERHEHVRVYHGGRFAYEVKRPSEEFWDRIEVCGAPGQKEFYQAPGTFDLAHAKSPFQSS